MQRLGNTKIQKIKKQVIIYNQKKSETSAFSKYANDNGINIGKTIPESNSQ